LFIFFATPRRRGGGGEFKNVQKSYKKFNFKMSSDDEVKGKKRKAEEEDGEASSTSGVEGIPTDDGLTWDLGGTKLLRVKVIRV